MRTVLTFVFAVVLAGTGFALPAHAEGDCGSYTTKSVDVSTPDQSLADSSTSQSAKPGN